MSLAEIDDRLLPQDGLNTYHVTLLRVDLATQGTALFTFAITESMLPTAELQVSVPTNGQSLDRMTVEAHDALIDILRQLIFRADKARTNHDRHVRPSGEELPGADRRAQPERRMRDPAFADFEVLE